MCYCKTVIVAAALIVTGLGLACGKKTRSSSSVEVRVYSVGNKGFGYALYQGGRKIIDQPTIPAVQQAVSFQSQEEAQSIAQLVNVKLRSGQFPPTVTIRELDSLRIHY